MRLLAYGGLADWPFGDLQPHSFSWLDVDAPWDFSLHSEKGGNKSAQKHYRCLPLDEIMAFPVQDLAAENCVLSLWATAPMLEQQMKVISRWGFKFKTEMIWRKTTKNGKQTFGPGYIARGSHEPVLIATRGAPKFVAKNIRSCFDGVRRKHSQKPEEWYDIVDRMLPKGERACLFSRTSRPKWKHWGDQVGVLDEGAPELEKRQLYDEKDQQDLLF